LTKITLFGGVREIGGNKILVESKEARIFLDFGQSFTLLDDFFVPEAYLFPRGRFGLRDYLALDLVPRIEGLYSPTALRYTDLPYKEPEFDAVFLSHPHMDHYDHLQFLDPKIPIHCGETCHTILRSAMEIQRAKVFNEESQVELFRSGKEVRVKDITIKPVHVDHSVPGAYGFLVDTGEKRIAYTGDIRSHGVKPQLTEDFLQAASAFDPDVLIIEGTRVAPTERRTNLTESEVELRSRDVISKSDGIALALRYPKDLDRFQTFYAIAKSEGKELVISQKTATLLLYLKDDPISLPDPTNDPTIKIFHRAKLRYEPWEERLEYISVGTDYIQKNRSSLILEMDTYYMNELVDIKPDKGSLIYSMSEPFEEDPVSFRVDEVLRNWASRFNLGYHQLHASGHASKMEIFEMVARIDPDAVLPVHCEFPELFEEAGKPLILAEKGKKIC